MNTEKRSQHLRTIAVKCALIISSIAPLIYVCEFIACTFFLRESFLFEKELHSIQYAYVPAALIAGQGLLIGGICYKDTNKKALSYLVGGALIVAWELGSMAFLLAHFAIH